MLERTSRFHFDDILAGNFVFDQDNSYSSLENKRGVRKRLCANSASKPHEVSQLSNDHIMTRKTRTRTPRIPTIQSGYCAVCNLPYNNVEEHIQSKKHQKLIGEDANYIALNGSLNGFLHTNSIPFLNLNGIDAIGVHETSLDEFSPPIKRRNMRRSRAPSVACDRPSKKAAPLSPTISEKAGHCLRSRKNINYMTPPLDDDSLQEPPDVCLPDEPPELQLPPPILQQECKEYRELRSSTRALAKLIEPVPPEPQEEVWNSGRPKRACIKQKRISLDETLSSNCKTFYKVEVVTSKSRSKRDTDSSRRQSQSPKRDGDEKKKGLIVKFKKLRNSELITLNNEATNFLFPKKEEESSEDDMTDAEVNNSTVGSIERANSVLSMCSDIETSNKRSKKILEEDDASMDSNCSRTKKRRRTHAEAFIRDNQKYYKFETPGSRLRYHGSYLSPIIKSPKHNGDNSTDKIKVEIKTEELESKNDAGPVHKSTFSANKYKFSFEKAPPTTCKYLPFFRQDRGEQDYVYFTDDAYWGDSFILPYQVSKLKPLDRKKCINRFKEVVKILREPVPESENNSSCLTPDSNDASSPFTFAPEHDDDSKMSGFTLSSTCSTEEDELTGKKRIRRSKSEMLQQTAGKNPRKSPRQHASTLAILSSFLQQRKRRSRNKQSDDGQSLPTILEEANSQQETIEEDQQQDPQEVPHEVSQDTTLEVPQDAQQVAPVVQTTKRGRKSQNLFKIKKVPKLDYIAIARQIDDELDTVLDGDIEEFDLDIDEDETVDFHQTKTSIMDVLKLYEDSKSKHCVKSYRRFLKGCPPGRKPGRKKKKNLTGWPNKSRRLNKRGPNKEKEDHDGSNVDTTSVHNDSDEEMSNEDGNNLTDSIKQEPKSDSCGEENCNVDRVDKDKNDKILTNKVTNSEFQLQPYVFVPKIDSKLMDNKNNIRRPKRTQRHMPASPRSPRVLRKPRGRWYKER